jgi:hypothetical protein
LIRDYFLEQIALLHERLCLIKEASVIAREPAERQIHDLNRRLAEDGVRHGSPALT